MTLDNKDRAARNLRWIGIIVVAVGGYFLYRYHPNYTYHSDWHVGDQMGAKFWTICWLFGSCFYLYKKRLSPLVPSLSVLALSAYFVVLYGLLLHGTDYGMNAHWGDNGCNAPL